MVKGFINTIKRLSKNRIFQHILFWSLSFLILTNLLKVSVEIKQIDLIYTAIFHVPILLIVYLNLRILFPIFLEKGKYLFYGISVLALIALGAGFYIILFDSWIDYIFSGYYFIAYYGFFDISLYFVIYIFVTSLLRLARGWFHLQEIKREKTLAELKALKSQINPHFLFNSLNSIYSLARKNSPQVPDKIIQLSDLMRHVIYNSDVEFIPLSKEIEMVRNYIELQNLRTSENEKISMEVIGDIEGKKVAPLIFLPFVENSFKHGLKSGAENAFVKIKLEVSGNSLSFEIENSKGKSMESEHFENKGIGIENVKKRLDLIYPGAYSLNILNNGKTYKVLLQLQIN
jgi:sensor histidine kinase YesM